MAGIKSLSFSREFDKQQLYFSFDSLTLSGDDQMTPGDNVDISFYFASKNMNIERDERAKHFGLGQPINSPHKNPGEN